ncbi:GNAT family N-acetyltransferase [Vallitalea maricola]|uniref:GNAT family N-acetyltransferase n=1 Tax=Vallitalea maricola TaxID=3074433 RepID=A0ACB5UMV9_9FIRM|nr:GNAT family N-acetyltransferase [Vallitalea sp. AN17-2]
MINAIYINGDKNIEDAIFVRNKVFVDEQNIDYNIVFDGEDKEAVHVVAYEDKNPVGTGRMAIKDNLYLIGRIAVLKEKRGNYYGDLIVRMLIQKAFDIGADFIEVHSQLPAVNFYRKIGFEECGEVYQEADIDHINMRLEKGKMKRKCNCK